MPAAPITALFPLHPGAGVVPPPGGLAANLVSFWEFTGSWADATAQHNDLAGAGGPSWTDPGIVGTAVTLNPATNAYLSNTTLNGMNLLAGDQWEWQGWVYPYTLAADMSIAGYSDGSPVVPCWQIRYMATANRFEVTVGTTTILSPSTAATNHWHFISAGQDAGNMFISINNGAMATAPRVNNPAGTPWLLAYGVSLDLTTFHWNGRIDQTGIWIGRTLTAPQRAYCYNGGLGRSYADISTANP